jgi:uncharacterized protein YeaO (DUF488 family)
MRVRVPRVYDEPGPEDGMRILVDRLWPQGISKERLVFDQWAKGLAPSTELRRWYGHEPNHFEEFRRRYRTELEAEPGAAQVQELRGIAGNRPITLITATRDVGRSGAALRFWPRSFGAGTE